MILDNKKSKRCGKSTFNESHFDAISDSQNSVNSSTNNPLNNLFGAQNFQNQYFSIPQPISKKEYSQNGFNPVSNASGNGFSLLANSTNGAFIKPDGTLNIQKNKKNDISELYKVPMVNKNGVNNGGVNWASKRDQNCAKDEAKSDPGSAVGDYAEMLSNLSSVSQNQNNNNNNVKEVSNMLDGQFSQKSMEIQPQFKMAALLLAQSMTNNQGQNLMQHNQCNTGNDPFNMMNLINNMCGLAGGQNNMNQGNMNQSNNDCDNNDKNEEENNNYKSTHEQKVNVKIEENSDKNSSSNNFNNNVNQQALNHLQLFTNLFAMIGNSTSSEKVKIKVPFCLQCRNSEANSVNNNSEKANSVQPEKHSSSNIDTDASNIPPQNLPHKNSNTS